MVEIAINVGINLKKNFWLFFLILIGLEIKNLWNECKRLLFNYKDLNLLKFYIVIFLINFLEIIVKNSHWYQKKNYSHCIKNLFNFRFSRESFIHLCILHTNVWQGNFLLVHNVCNYLLHATFLRRQKPRG